jgi:hypothetical protein
MTPEAYGPVDRALHRLAFGTLRAQRRLADIETRMYHDRIEPDHGRRPVFVTSLPRAGTTVLLEALAALPEFAAATYRHMPFTLLPLIWTDASRRFQQEARPAERAHGDGVAVGFDSPEAFEETIWMAFWPERYRDGCIRPWTEATRDQAFEAFLRAHMAKVVAASGGDARRYLSKNNANIARLPLIATAFPDATVVVPVREPFAQTASLLRQHKRFLEMHAQDAFALRYMEGLGHFEFGAALRPIAWGTEIPDPAAAESAEFWLAYWADAYEEALSTAGEHVVFVDYDALAAAPVPHLRALTQAVGARPGPEIAAAAARFRPSRPGQPPEAPAGLIRRARAIHDDLRARCIDADAARMGVVS